MGGVAVVILGANIKILAVVTRVGSFDKVTVVIFVVFITYFRSFFEAAHRAVFVDNVHAHAVNVLMVGKAVFINVGFAAVGAGEIGFARDLAVMLGNDSFFIVMRKVD